MDNRARATASSPAFGGASLEGRAVAFLIAPGRTTGQAEMHRPWEAVTVAGGRPVLVCSELGEIRLPEHPDHGERLPVDKTLAEADPRDFDALVLPGAAPDAELLRTDPAAVEFTRAFFTSGKPVAAISHAPHLLVAADLVRGRALTGWPGLREDVVAAGGTWRDERVVVCEKGPNVLVTGRNPQDLPVFCETLVRRFAAAPPR
jgi:protease I